MLTAKYTMSLETLLEAARYLHKVEQNAVLSESWIEDGQSSGEGGRGCGDTGGHLLIDPNLPISCQFHTYSSSAPAVSTKASKPLAFPVNSTKNNSSHSEPGTNGMTISPVLPSSLSSQSSTLSSSPNSSSSYRRRALSTGSNSSGKGHRSSRYSESSHEADPIAFNRHREMHKTSEKNRRAHLRDCFEQLKKELPQPEYRDRKSSHINIINCALRYIQNLKKKEAENETEMARLARAKARHQNTISQLRQDLDNNHVDVEKILTEVASGVTVDSSVAVTVTTTTASSTVAATLPVDDFGANPGNGILPTNNATLIKSNSTLKLSPGSVPIKGDCDEYHSDGEVIAIITNNMLSKFVF